MLQVAATAAVVIGAGGSDPVGTWFNNFCHCRVIKSSVLSDRRNGNGLARQGIADKYGLAGGQVGQAVPAINNLFYCDNPVSIVVHA